MGPARNFIYLRCALFFLSAENSLSAVITRLRSWSLRKFVFAILVLGIVGLIAELLLIEHTESWTQWIPLVCLFAGLVSCIWVALSPGANALRVFQFVMAGFVVAGIAGLYFHYAGNVEFALERDSSLRGPGLVWKALTGATPALAPGALAQLGLLGLAYSCFHPITRSGDSS
ncbi:MAG TPA: hypothetical protein VJZ25_00815 [Gemmatimonadaceae bacterium]|nr:hypothetical protein [Gemmatimonadaceae bacterium]